MRIIFAGGGTAGHINPALAVAEYIRENDPNAEILYVGAKGGMEENLVAKAGFNFKGIKISGFSRKLNFEGIKKNIVTVKRIITSSMESKKIIQEFKPDICMGTGGYVSGPILRTAARMGVPIIIHEQNAFPGVTSKMLSKYAKRIMLAIPGTEKYFGDNCSFSITGNPVRKEIIHKQKDEARKELGLDHRPVILSFGGSLGARKINEPVADLIAWSCNGDKFQHIHAYGKYGTWFPDLLKEKGVVISDHTNLDIREYIDNMPTCLAAADLVICRSGAITISELQVQGKPAILIPSPNVAENHQYHNAMALVRAGAASIIEEKDLNSQKLIETVEKMLQDPEYLEKCSKKAKSMAITDSNQRIYSIIKDISAEYAI